MKVLDLFAGLGGWSDIFVERGHDVRTLDYDDRFYVDYPVDILEWSTSELQGWRPDLILASPPCEGFSVINIGQHWTREHEPRTRSARLSLSLVKRTLEVIEELSPRYFIIENPRAKLRSLPVLAHLERRTVWYCHLGETMAKPTDLWGGFPESFRLPPECHKYSRRHKSTCCCRDHTYAPRGSRTLGSIQGHETVSRVDEDKAKIPELLATIACLAAERDLESQLV